MYLFLGNNHETSTVPQRSIAVSGSSKTKAPDCHRSHIKIQLLCIHLKVMIMRCLQHPCIVSLLAVTQKPKHLIDIDHICHSLVRLYIMIQLLCIYFQATIMRRLQHPSVVSLLAVAQRPKHLIVMEFAPCRSLNSILQSNAPLSRVLQHKIILQVIMHFS